MCVHLYIYDIFIYIYALKTQCILVENVVLLCPALSIISATYVLISILKK